MAFVNNVSFLAPYSFSNSDYGNFLDLSLSISIIFCFLALAAASYCSFYSSRIFFLCSYSSLSVTTAAPLILSSSYLDRITASAFLPFSVSSLSFLSSSLERAAVVPLALFSLVLVFPISIRLAVAYRREFHRRKISWKPSFCWLLRSENLLQLTFLMVRLTWAIFECE